MNQKLTNVEKRQKELSLSKIEIMRILNWDDLQFGEFQYEEGLKFLEHYIEDREHQLTRSATFWNWWKNEWAFRDESLLINGIDIMNHNDVIDLYKAVHNGSILCNEIHPNRGLLDRSYSQMIDEFTKEELARNRAHGR